MILMVSSLILIYIILCNTVCSNTGETEYDKSRITALLCSIIINTFFVFLSTEILSLFSVLTFASILVFWILVNLIAISIIFLRYKKGKIGIREIKSGFSFKKPKVFSINSLTILVCLSAVFISLLTVPYNWDSMTYHLTRIAHWAKNSSVAHYACHDISQISDPPLAEFVNLHVYILSGNTDYFLNLLQTFSYLVTVCIVYKISERIGCDEKYRSLAALLYSTTPIVYGEALSTQVDLFSGLWLLMFAWFSLDFVNQQNKLELNKDSVIRLVSLGACAGFSYVAKPSVIFGILVFAVWIVIICIIKKNSIISIIQSGLIVSFIGGILILPEVLRNFKTFGSYAAAESSSAFIVPSFKPAYLIVNLTENILFNLSNIFVDVTFVCKLIDNSLKKLLFGSYETPWGLNTFEYPFKPTSMNHDIASNPAMISLFLLTVFSIIFLWIIRMIKRNDDTGREYPYKGYIFAAVLSASAFFSIARWYEYIIRYEVGYFALIAPAIMLQVQIIISSKTAIRNIYSILIVTICILTFGHLGLFHIRYVYKGGDRNVDYFRMRGNYEPYAEAVDLIKKNGCKRIGFICGGDSYEYPLWKMLEKDIDDYEHICVENETSVYEKAGFKPDCIVIADMDGDDTITRNGVIYHKSLSNDNLMVYFQ